MKLYKILIFTFVVFAIFSCNNQTEIDIENTSDIDTLPPPPPNKMYELVIDSFIIEHGEVEPNDNLSSGMLAAIFIGFRFPVSMISSKYYG